MKERQGLNTQDRKKAGPVTVLFSGGGTGGHFFPLAAVASALLERAPGSRVLFVGTRRGIESRMCGRMGFPLVCLPVEGFAGRGPAARFRVLALLPMAVAAAVLLCLKWRPSVVVGSGGYASFPSAVAAGILGIPLLLLEQNIVPGMANRMLSILARAVALSFPETQSRFPARGIVTGNPVRPELLGIGVPAEEGELRLLVLGGSRGARPINRVVGEALPLLARVRGLNIVHQTGTEDLERVRETYADSGLVSRVEGFLFDMRREYSEAHLVLCRAGATTLAELAAAGRPAILVPFPHAAGDHQTANARGFERAGAAVCIAESDLTPDRLWEIVDGLRGRSERERMGSRMRGLGRPRAAWDIAGLVLRMGEAA